MFYIRSEASFQSIAYFFSHAAHHLLAIYALGASAPVIDAAYQTHVAYQRPAVASPGVITAKTFNDHLGQEV
jgi:hypothetical protein